MRRILLLFSMMALWFNSTGQLTAPFTESFDNSSLPAGWVNNTVDPWRFSGSMAYDAAIIGDHTGTAGSWFAWVDGSGGTNALTPLETDSIDISGLITPQISFYLSSYNPSYIVANGSNTFSVDLYDGSSWNTGIYTHAGSFPGWRYVTIDISSYTITGDIVVRFNVNTTTSIANAYYNDIAIDDVSVEEVPPCPFPQGIVDSNVAATTADIGWGAVTPATSYTVIYGAPGFDPNTAGSTATSSTNSVTLTSLTGATDYDVYVYADCSTNGLSDTAGPHTFTTACVPFASPYSTDFDSDALDQLPLCWSDYQTSTLSFVEVEDFNSSNSGTQHLQIYNAGMGSGDSLIAISPELSDLPLGTQQIHFFARTTDPATDLIIGTMSDPTDGSTFDALDTIVFTTAISAGASYEEFIIPLTVAAGYNGNDKYVGFMHGNGTTFDYIDIDDFVAEVIPPCPQLTGLTMDSVSASSVTVSFTGTGTSFDYEYGPVGFTQGTGTVGSFAGNPGTVTGLLDATCYDIYIRNNCTAGGNGTSSWIGPLTFCTQCLVQSLPYSEDFNVSLGCFQAVDGGATADTWFWIQDYFGNSLDATPFAFVDSDGAGSGAGLLFELMESPYIDAGNIQGTLILEFDQYFNSIGNDSANVEVWDGTSWVQVFTQANTSVGSWANADHQSINLTPYAHDSLRVRFEYDDRSTWAWYWAVDNVTITDVICAQSTDAVALVTSADSLQIGWTPGAGLSYHIEYGSSGFSPGSGTVVTTTGTSMVANGLSPNTTYDFYITDSCALGNSLVSGPFSFLTDCAVPSPVALPWNEDFESYSTSHQVATNWCNSDHSLNYINSDPNGRLRFNAGAGFYNNNSAAAATLDRSLFGNESDNFLTFTFNLSSYTTTPGIVLEFYYMHSGQEPHAEDRVWVRGTSADPWVQIYNLNTNQGATGNFNHVTNLNIVSVLAAAGQSVSTTTQIRFGQAGTSTAFSPFFTDGYTFDDISLTAVTCPAPTGLSANGIIDTSANFTWLGSTGASSYDVWFGPQGFYQGSTTIGGSQVNTSTNSYQVDTLTPNSCYEYAVRTICSNGDTSVWVGPFVFCTPCSPFFATYSEDFDAQPAFQVPDCWAELFVGANAANADVEVIPFGLPNSTPNQMEIYNWFLNDSVIAASPFFGDMTPGDKRISFYAKQSFGLGATLILGTLSSQGEAGSFVPMDTFTLTDQHQKFTTYLTTANGYNGTHQYVGFMHGQQATFQTLYVDDVVYEQIPTCIEPINLGITNIGTASADAYWSNLNASAGLNYEIEYGLSGTTLGAIGNSTMTSTNDTVTLSSLSDGTDYCYWVREICAVGDTSIWSGPFCFKTFCLPKTARWTEDFDGVQANSQLIPNCWEEAIVGVNAINADIEVVTFGATPVSAPNQLEIYNWFLNDTIMAVSPEFSDLPMSDKQVKFHAAQSFGTGATLIVGTLPSPFNVGAFTPIDTVTLTATHQLFIIPLDTPGSGYNGTDEYIGFMHGQQATFQTINIDDFIYETIPSCPEPINGFAISLGSNSATLSWDVFGSGTSWDISVGAPGFTPSPGTVFPNDTATVTSLQPNTTYEWYVREICGTGDTSIWSGPYTFVTACTAFNAPFFEDFESHTLGWFRDADNCWTIQNTNPNLLFNTSGYSWEMRNSQQTSSTGTGASGDNTLYPAIGGQFLNADVSYGSNGDSSMLISPIIDISSLVAPELEYHLHRYGTNMADFYVDIFDGTNWINGVHAYTNSFGTQTANGDPYTDTIIDLMPYLGTTNFQVRFRTVSNGCCPGDNGLDDIRISDPVTCPLPDSLYANTITANSANIGWIPGTAGNTSFQISYGAGINNPVNGTTMSVTGTSTSLTGLTANTNYCFFVREICGPGDTSAYKGPLCFSTLCNTLTAPYFEDFESNTLGFFQGTDNCWDIINNSPNLPAFTSGYVWELRNVVQASSGGTGASGDNTLYPAIGGQFFNADVSYGSAGDSSLLVSPVIDITPLATPTLKYHLHRYGTNMANFYVDVYDGTQWVNGLHSYTNLTGPQSANSDPYTDTTLSLVPYAGITNFRVRFRTVSNGCCPGDNGLDDIAIYNDSSTVVNCPAPTGLAATANVGCDSIEVSWNGNANGSFLEYGAPGFTPGTGAGTAAYSTSPYVMSNLTAGTSYDVYVIDTCNGGNDTSALVGPISVSTASGPLPVASFTYTVSYGAGTQTVDFDASGSTGATSYSWDFGNTNTGSGVTTSETYTNNGTVNVTLTVTNACGTDDTIVPVLINIGLAENALSRSLQVYPNPARDVVSVKFTTAGSEDAVIRVLELSGKEVLRVNSTDLNGKYDDQISITDLAKGIYVLEVESGDLKAQRRIVKH